MIRMLIILNLTLLLMPAPGATAQDTTATPGAPALDDPDAIVAAIEEAEPPATLTGNEDEPIVVETWEDYYGQPLDAALGAWVTTGSPQFPIATVIVFDSPQSAEAGLGEFARDSAEVDAGPLEAYAIADRGKWLCMATDGPVLLIGQAEPVPGEEEDVVRDRACAALAETHAWVVTAVTGTPPATPAVEPAG
jgi:hypothetical protein